MKSLLVFFLWMVVCLVGLCIIMPLWMVCVTMPRILWHVYRNNDCLDSKKWEEPWFPTAWMVDRVKKLDPKNRKLK